ncbi:MAG: hydroxypyruvate isomerase family protein [Proteobacteria bacterium]|nr:hydroxypyruvate isomerase family protein [Pseudomonadota bacterium]
MPQFAANLSFLYNEHAFLDRFAAAAADGFRGVEYLFPYEFSAAELRNRLDASNVQQVLFNCPPGDWARGERGIASLPGREAEFRRGMEQALHYAEALGCKRLHVMAGLLDATHGKERQRAVYLENLAYAARQAALHGVTVLIEPINTRDMPGYFLHYQQDAHAICREVQVPNLKVQFDLYHCQIMEGDLAATMQRELAGIGHMQIAGVPERHEPDLGEVHYPYLFSLMDALGYQEWVGCEYRPRGNTSAGLGWLQPWLKKPAS